MIDSDHPTVDASAVMFTAAAALAQKDQRIAELREELGIVNQRVANQHRLEERIKELETALNKHRDDLLSDESCGVTSADRELWSVLGED